MTEKQISDIVHFFIKSANGKTWWILDPVTKMMHSSRGETKAITGDTLGPLKRIFKAVVCVDPESNKLIPKVWPISGAGLKKPTSKEITDAFGIIPHNRKGVTHRRNPR